MKHSCHDSNICVDKPNLSKLSPSMQMSGLYKQTEEEKLYPERPLYRTEIGRMTWKVMHRIAAICPESPTIEDKYRITKMCEGLSTNFPCKECAEHFREEIKKLPPEVEDYKIFSKWLCYQHNQVNKRLGKELYDCDNLQRILSEFKL